MRNDYLAWRELMWRPIRPRAGPERFHSRPYCSTNAVGAVAPVVVTDILIDQYALIKVTEKTGKPRASIYREMQAGTFPRPERIGPRAVAWRLSELCRWMEAPRNYQVD